MGNSRQDSQLITDLYRFSKLCEFVGESASNLSETAMRLGFVSAGGLSRCMERLEQRYGCLATVDGQKIKITQNGRMVKEYYDSIVSSSVHKLDQKYLARAADQRSSIHIGASPFILAHMMPYIIGDFLDSVRVGSDTNSSRVDESTKVSCIEAYYLDETIQSILKHEIDFAIVWNHNQRAKKILATRGLTCLKASKSFDAVVVFGKNHSEFRQRLVNLNDGKSTPCVTLEELDKEWVLVLEDSHQPFGDRISTSTLDEAGIRTRQTTILSMISAIRSGWPAVAVIPGVYRYLDEFRRDASLFCLPLKANQNDLEALQIELLYVFRCKGSGVERDKLNPLRFSKENLWQFLDRDSYHAGWNKETSSSPVETIVQFIKRFEEILSEGVFGPSGWQLGNDTQKSQNQLLTEEFSSIHEYKHSYFITSEEVGLDVPRWEFARVTINKKGDNVRLTRSVEQISSSCPHTGSLNVIRSNNFIDEYNIVVWLVTNQVITMWGDRSNKGSDSFVANLYVVGHGKYNTWLVGIWSGSDERAKTALSAPFILSRKPLTPEDFRSSSFKAMLRTLTNVRAKPPRHLDSQGSDYVI